MWIIICGSLGHKMIRNLVASIGLFLAVACGAPMESQQITTTVGKQFDVRLTAVATGGYLWDVKELPPEIKSEGSDRTPSSKLPGAPVEQVFHFSASKTGDYTITLIYKRSWETTVEKTETVKVTVH